MFGWVHGLKLWRKEVGQMLRAKGKENHLAKHAASKAVCGAYGLQTAANRFVYANRRQTGLWTPAATKKGLPWLAVAFASTRAPSLSTAQAATSLSAMSRSVMEVELASQGKLEGWPWAKVWQCPPPAPCIRSGCQRPTPLARAGNLRAWRLRGSRLWTHRVRLAPAEWLVVVLRLARVEYLPCAGGEVPMADEELWERDGGRAAHRLRPEIIDEVPDLARPRPRELVCCKSQQTQPRVNSAYLDVVRGASAEERVPARAAVRDLRVGIAEEQGAACEIVHVRGQRVLVPVCPKLGAQVVHGNEQHVRGAGGWWLRQRLRRRGRRRGWGRAATPAARPISFRRAVCQPAAGAVEPARV